MAIEDLLVKLAKMFPKPKLQTVFLINNYDLTIAILKVGTFCWKCFLVYKNTTCIALSKFIPIFLIQEAGTDGGKAQLHFEEVLKSNIAIYVVCTCLIDGAEFLWQAKYRSLHFLILLVKFSA